jgi:uncharacterized protein
MLVQMQLARIIITEISDSQIIYLKEVDGAREFPILIGIFEATSIDRRVKSEAKPVRPLPHDLIIDIVLQLGGLIESVVIRDLRDQMYFASLQIRRGDELLEIDARPSDAIAVAVSYSPPLPIYVSEDVLEIASKAKDI